MTKALTITGIAIFFVFSLLLLSFSQETLTITTYYPSPYGVYRDARVTNSFMLQAEPVASDGPQIEWRTSSVGTDRHWNIDQYGDRLRFFTERNSDDGAGAERMTILENGNVGIGTTSPQAILDVSSTSSGFLPPRMTTAQRDAIPLANRVAGMTIYNTTRNIMEYWDGFQWVVQQVEIRRVKTVNQSTTSSALINDNDLRFAVGPNQTWQFEIVAIFRVDAAGDLKVSLGGPSAFQYLRAFVTIFFGKSGTDRTDTYKAEYVDSFAVETDFNIDSDLYTEANIKGTITTGANGGNLIFQWAKRTTAAPALLLYRGSYIIARRID